MSSAIKLKRSPYTSARVSVQRGKLYGTDNIKNLAQMSFDELIRYLEEHGFRSSVDKSYLQYEGFYLIERILNDHLSNIYQKVFSMNSKNNRIFLETYYLKYQIHNLMAVVRCKIAKEKDIESFLIGSERKKSKFIKAYEMPNFDDALIYLSKKLGFDEKEIVEKNKAGVYELENYLYKKYYEKLYNTRFTYNKKDERYFFRYIRIYIDLLNARTLLKLKVEQLNMNFNDMYIQGGFLDRKYFENIDSKNVEETLQEFENKFGSLELDSESSKIAGMDKRINKHKKESNTLFKKSTFGSPFYAIKYLFEIENEIRLLRILLKAKYLKMSQEETIKLLQ